MTANRDAAYAGVLWILAGLPANPDQVDEEFTESARYLGRETCRELWLALEKFLEDTGFEGLAMIGDLACALLHLADAEEWDWRQWVPEDQIDGAPEDGPAEDPDGKNERRAGWTRAAMEAGSLKGKEGDRRLMETLEVAWNTAFDFSGKAEYPDKGVWGFGESLFLHYEAEINGE